MLQQPAGEVIHSSSENNDLSRNVYDASLLSFKMEQRSLIWEEARANQLTTDWFLSPHLDIY